MKRINLTLLIACLTSYGLRAQDYDIIEIPVLKTVHLVFETKIIDMDVGSPKIDLRDMGTRLSIYAKESDFKTTNLFIETQDCYYNFVLVYNENPKFLLKKYGIDKATLVKEKKPIKTETAELREDDNITAEARIVSGFRGDLTVIGVQEEKMVFYVDGIYAKGDHIFLRVNIENQGNIRYDIDFIRFVTRGNGKRASRKTASQEEVLEPVKILNQEIKSVNNGEKILKVFVFEKFTIESKKRLFIEFWEVNGDRELEIKIRSRDLLEARTF